jgi:molybdate transport system permease protein
VPAGYALSRYRFWGHAAADAIVDLPIVMPPVVVGLSLLVFFSTRPGMWAERVMSAAGWDRYAGGGIVLCQFIMAAPYAIRSTKAAFDGADRRLEDLALTLGCTRLRAFFTVALPLARNGIIAGCIMAWARAVGVFGPLIIFVGCVRLKSEVMPTTVYLEVSTGGIEVAIAVAMIMIAIAGVALAAVHALVGRRRGWAHD